MMISSCIYTNHYSSIYDLSQVLCALTLVVDREIVNTAKSLLTTKFDQLCIYLLKYIPGHPEAQWCILPALLTRYGVSLPLHLQDTISKHVIFPGEQKPLVEDLGLFRTNIPDCHHYKPVPAWSGHLPQANLCFHTQEVVSTGTGYQGFAAAETARWCHTGDAGTV